MEWHSVYILQPFSLPLQNLAEGKEVPEWERIQEQNVAYVAVTRAIKELLFLKHIPIQALREDPTKIVEVFGEEGGSSSDEKWWDEHQRKGTFEDAENQTPETAFPGLDLQQASELLQIEVAATAADIKAAFKKKALIYHPDKVEEHLKIAYGEHFKKILAAKDLLLAHLVSEKLELKCGVGSVVSLSTQFGLQFF